MPKSGRESSQDSFIEDIFPEQPAEEPVASPPAPSSSSRGKKGKGGDQEASEPRGQQLSLPIEPGQGSGAHPTVHPRAQRKGTRGFVPVTHDPDVARSYSDNASIDQAISYGLAQVLASMPPEELAALKEKVARAAARDGRRGPSRPSR